MKPSLVGRLMLAYAVVLAAVLLSAWWGLRSLSDAEHAAQRLSDRSVQGLDLAAKLETLVRDKSRLADYLLSGDQATLDAIRPHRAEFAAWFDEMGAFVRTDTERKLLDGMRSGWSDYTAAADRVVQLQQDGQAAEARRVFVTLSADVERLLASGEELFRLAAGDMRNRRAAAEADIARGRTLVLWLTGLGAVLSLGLGLALSRYAARPIYRLVLQLGAAGVGDQIQVDGNELGVLEAHVNALLERVRRQEGALQQAEKLSELGEIATEIAHETLNPVTGVRGMLQALQRGPVPPDQLKSELAEMERQLGRVANTVRRLMSYARPLEPCMGDVSVRRLVEEAVRTAQLAPGATGRPIRAHGIAGDLEWRLDPELIEQVLVNLLINGCEASPPGAAVELRTDVLDDSLRFVVRDHGAGMTPAARTRLFHPFFTTKPNGNGLGLAVSRNIVREHGGRIDVLPDNGRGTAFQVVLPRSEAPCASRS
jgi:signal transduction histidine kinase